MKYRAYSVKLNNGLETFGLLPLSKECNIVDGKFFLESNTLLLISENETEKFDLIEKFDDYGDFKINPKNGKNQVERLRVVNPYNYQLSGDDVIWFLDEFVVNAEFAKNIVYSSKLKIDTPSLITTDVN